MARAGYARELADAYCGIRRDLLDEYLYVLGVEHLSIDKVQRVEWKQLKDKMKKWVQGVKTVVRVLLAGEHRLYDQVLAVSDELREECFIEFTKGCIMQILNFGEFAGILGMEEEHRGASGGGAKWRRVGGSHGLGIGDQGMDCRAMARCRCPRRCCCNGEVLQLLAIDEAAAWRCGPGRRERRPDRSIAGADVILAGFTPAVMVDYIRVTRKGNDRAVGLGEKA